MIEIITTKGEKWEFDPESKLLFKNQTVIPSREAEPVYTNTDKSIPPVFSGIHVKATNSIISLTGKINKITNIEED